MTRFIKDGYNILIPFGGSSRYDFVIEKDGVFKRIQVKKATVTENILIFSTSSTLVGTTKVISRGYTDKDIDMFAAVDIDKSLVYLMSVNEVSKSKQTLRLRTPKNNQVKGIKLAETYLMK